MSGGVGESGPTRHWLHYVGVVQWYCWPRHTISNLQITCVFAELHFQDKYFAVCLVIGAGCGHVLFADTPIAYNCCVTATEMFQDPPGATESWSHVGSLGLRTCRFHVCLGEPSQTRKILFTVYPHINCSELLCTEMRTQSHQTV